MVETSHGVLSTHVVGLDEVLGGGIPAGSVVLISGLPGTMKSTLAYWILAKDAQAGNGRSLYVSLEQPKAQMQRHLAALDPTLVSESESLRVVDAEGIFGARRGGATSWPGQFLNGLEAQIAAQRANLLAIDSLNALRSRDPTWKSREDLIDLFDWLKRHGFTVLITKELYQADGSAGDEDYLADGILVLSVRFLSEVEAQRRLRVVKLRGACHELAPYGLLWDGKRFEVYRSIEQ